jgi:hypothetical protein
MGTVTPKRPYFAAGVSDLLYSEKPDFPAKRKINILLYRILSIDNLPL